MNEIEEENATSTAAPIAKIPRYRRFRRIMAMLSGFVSLMPLLILTAFYYHLDQTALQSEIKYNVSQILSNTKRTLEFIIEERLSALTLLINQEQLERLDDDQGLLTAFQNLKNTFGGFVDLGLIDSDGTQRHYIGPYKLHNQNYYDQSWFHEVSLRNIYISDVFMGHRNFPHFIIAVKKETADGDFYVLRASIDLAMLGRQFHNADYNREFDAYLINKDGVLQTESIEFGSVFERYPLEVPKYAGGREVLAESAAKGKITVTGHSYIEKSPFILIVTNQRSSLFKSWLKNRMDLVWFLMISAVLIIITVILSANYMVARIQEADQKRTKLLHNIEYTNKMATIGRMAAGVAHEINNPLAIINEKAGLLKDMMTYNESYPHREKILKSVDSIIGSVERCSKVTHRLLGFGRRLDSHREIIDLEALLKEVLGFISKEAEHRNIHVDIRASEQVHAIESDRGQLQQVFLNIINNAFAAVTDGGRIEIGIDAPSSHTVSVSIRDNGVGISEENLKNIFEPFFSTKGQFGTGLGLSITHEIVEKLGGNIAVVSKLGECTQFTITLPATSPV